MISSVLPKDIENFDLVDGMWIAHPRKSMSIMSVNQRDHSNPVLERQQPEEIEKPSDGGPEKHPADYVP
ncbi:hypothetical protein QA645_05175 [Bradyrhizobium sp. CIAT3101]|nr:hypothetical protein [Bradyrhizobium sp. CIAT3101]WFU85337.1 hypothetical protein QA645_05175 [Bradyrhizobium sp. CIAT3101]